MKDILCCCIGARAVSVLSTVSLALCWTSTAFAEPVRQVTNSVENCVTLAGTSTLLARRTQSCTRTASTFTDATFQPLDAYYRISIKVDERAGFSKDLSFDRNDSSGKVIGRFLDRLFQVKKPRTFSVGFQISDGVTSYPLIVPISFEYDDAARKYVSAIRYQSATLLRRLPAGSKYSVTLKAVYGTETSINPGAVFESLKAAIPTGNFLLTPASSAIVDLAGTFSTSLLNVNRAAVDVSSTFVFSPGYGDSISETLDLVDPAQAGTSIANIKIELQATRSLLVDPFPFAQSGATLPTGAAGPVSVDDISQRVVIGQAKDWPLPVSALAGTSTAGVGTDFKDETSLKTMCGQMESKLASQFALSGIDRTLVMAKAVELATGGSRGRTYNPYKTCFRQEQLVQIVSLLGISIADPPSSPAQVSSSQVADKPVLDALGCWLKGAVGDQCGTLEQMRATLADRLADTVQITALEGVDAVPELVAAVPDAGLTRDQFLQRFAGRFARFHDYNLAKGSMLVNVGQGRDLVLRAKTADHKISEIGIRNN
jgi:hypothetical protein